MAALRGRAADDAVRAFDAERHAAVERAVDRFEDDPRAALSLLESSALGIDRLMAAWGELDAALEAEAAGWCQRYHKRLMLLLGHPDGTDLLTAGRLPTASARLLASRAPGAKPLPAGEADESVAGLRRLAAQAIDRLRDLRRHAPDTSGDRRRAAEAASGDMTAERSCGTATRWRAGPLAPRHDLPAHRPGPLGAPTSPGPPLRPGRPRSREQRAGGRTPRNGRGGRSRGRRRAIRAPPESPPPDPEAAAPASLRAGAPASIPARPEAPICAPKGPAPAPEGASGGGSTP